MINILIPTIPEREDKLNRLLDELKKQIGDNEFINIIVDNSKPHSQGGLTIGGKRQALLDKCPENGYSMFIDDDDWIAPNYIQEILKASLNDSDIITFKSLVQMHNWWGICEMRLGNPTQGGTPNGIFKRPPFHMCAIKTSKSKSCSFPTKGKLSMYGEDWEYMKQILPHCKTETHIDMILHNYKHSPSGSRADNV